MFTWWVVGERCGEVRQGTTQAHLCGDGGSGWGLVVLAAVVVSIFVPTLTLVRLWRRIGAWALLPAVALTIVVPVVATYALDLAPG